MVQKQLIPTNIISGTAELRLEKIYLEGPKATQSDWFLLSSYLSVAECNNIFNIYAINEATGNVYTLDTFTCDGDDYKLDLTGSEVGTVTVVVTYWTEA